MRTLPDRTRDRPRRQRALVVNDALRVDVHNATGLLPFVCGCYSAARIALI
ncbi:hypothetical protein BURMUCGD2_4450 [Burkholderia multivorans CGD2]|uniref:Uncharacterized protein n=1 Tax=Burkholderia multivorans CGD2 TaxID=513052 RepID=B9BH15_9BURK|nr:hypothetical protein BURMUCGD2_4450 [Burkholderia multivorans CGD2]